MQGTPSSARPPDDAMLFGPRRDAGTSTPFFNRANVGDTGFGGFLTPSRQSPYKNPAVVTPGSGGRFGQSPLGAQSTPRGQQQWGSPFGGGQQGVGMGSVGRGRGSSMDLGYGAAELPPPPTRTLDPSASLADMVQSDAMMITPPPSDFKAGFGDQGFSISRAHGGEAGGTPGMDSRALTVAMPAQKGPTDEPAAFHAGGSAAPTALPFDCWVCVFGFSEQDKSSIIQEFQKCGEIMQWVYPRGGGNWMYLQFAHKGSTAAAIRRNGITLNRSLMVGVLPVTTERDQGEILAQTQNGQATPQRMLGHTTPGMSSMGEGDSTPAGKIVRPYHIDAGTTGGMPQPSRSTWNKVAEYVFGM